MSKILHTSRACAFAAVLSCVAASVSAQTPIKLKTADGSAAITVGVLAQGTYQSDAAGDTTNTDLGFRRFRFMTSASLGKHLRLFADTDTPYAGYHGANGWALPATYLQDLIVTYQVSEKFQVDGGLLLIPGSYNGLQSATSLLAVGYSPYSFLASTPTHSRVGRDQGLQARGYLFGKRFEYRTGIYRGARKVDDTMPYRSVSRAVWYPFGAASTTSLFYPGTQLGKRTQVSVGASFDRQDRYTARGVDAFAEWKQLSGNVVTLQADYVRYDGGTTFPQLARQHTWLAEAGYQFKAVRVGPYFQVARQDLVNPALANALAYQAGLVYWRKGHTLNLKAGVGRTMKDRAATHTQVVVQTQFFAF